MFRQQQLRHWIQQHRWRLVCRVILQIFRNANILTRRYAMERTADFIKVWFWERGATNVPSDVKSTATSSESLGQPPFTIFQFL